MRPNHYRVLRDVYNELLLVEERLDFARRLAVVSLTFNALALLLLLCGYLCTLT